MLSRRPPGVASAAALLLCSALLAVVAAPGSGATHAGAPSISQPRGALPPVRVEPAASASAQLQATSRDCGFSVELSDGAALWVFCDSSDSPSLTYFRNSTAALALPGAPTELHEPTDEAGRPHQLVTVDPADSPCVDEHAGELLVVWPRSAARIELPGGIDRVLISFLTLCLDKEPGVAPTLVDYTGMEVGLATWDRDPTAPMDPDAPIVATVVEPALWPVTYDGLGKITTFGAALVAGGDGFVYTYRCGWDIGCQVARAPEAAAADASAHTFWTGIGWQATPPASGTVGLSGTGPPLSSMRVVHLPAMGLYAMAYAAFPGAGTDSINLRVAEHPWGPFSPATSIVVPDCADGDGCYSAAPHSSLSGIGHVGVSIYDGSRPGTPHGSVVVAVAQLDSDAAVAGACRTAFTDVDDGSPFCAEVDWAADGSLVRGYADGTFGPGAPVTRQAVAAMLWRFAGSPPGPFAASGHADVDVDHTFATAIAWLTDAGLADGYADGTFRPGVPLTRQAAVAWFHRWAGSPSGPHPDPGFVDAPGDHPFGPQISWAASSGLTTGYVDATFRPAAAVTRQALVAWLHRTDP